MGNVDDAPQPPPPPVPSQTADSLAAKDNRAIEDFVDRVRQILAQQRGMTATSRAMLDSEARRLGLTPQQSDDAIRTLRDVSSPPLPTAPSPGDADASPKAPPIQAPPPDSPQTVFLAYVREALSRSTKPLVSQKKERRLVGEGVDKLGLAHVLARQIVHRVATDLGKCVASPDENSTEADHEEDLREPPGLPEFLERAASILAEQRGINARSRVLLAAAAGEFGLSDAEMERGISALNAAAPDTQPEDLWLAEREQAFREHLCEVFALLPHRVATARIAQTWVAAGERRFGLQRDTAEHWVHVVATKQRVRVITEDQATEHLTNLIGQLLEQSSELDENTRARIFNEGGQWGLTPIQVDVILRERWRAKKREESAFPWLTALFVTLGLAGVLATVGLLGWLLVLRRGSEVPLPDIQVARELGEDPPDVASAQPPPIDVPTGDEWWSRDEDLLVAVTQTRAVLPEMKAVLSGLNVQEPEDRALAYRQLIRAAATHSDQADQRAVLQDLIAGCFAADPSDRCAAAIADELMALIPSVGDNLPERDSGYEAAFWAVRTAVTVFVRPELAEARRAELALAVDRKLGSSTDISLDPRDLQRKSLRAFCQHLYRVIIAGARTQPLVARPLFEYVTREAVRCLDLPSIERANVEFLAAALPVAGEAWREFASQIQRSADSADPLVVLRLVELFEQTEDSSLQAFLADRLLRRAGVFPRSMAPEQVARTVRKALGAEEVATISGRRESLTRAAEDLLATTADAGRDELLQQIVELAHAETMACALSLGAVGDATFAALQKDGAVRLSARPQSVAGEARRRKPERAAAAFQRDNVQRYIQYLLNPRGRVAQRRVFLRSIAMLASDVPDLDEELAQKLAAYLLRPKPDDEHELILEHVGAIGRWRTLRLALADQVLDTKLQADRVQDILTKILPRWRSSESEPMWRERAHEALLEDVLQGLSTSDVGGDTTDGMVDQLADVLRELYVTQARLLGVSADAYAAAANPSDVLRLIVETYAAQTSADARIGSASLPYEFDAVEYVAGNDLERTVLLQRVWLQTLVASMERERPREAEVLRRLITELQQTDVQATDLFVQLHAGHRTLLQIWLLADEG